MKAIKNCRCSYNDQILCFHIPTLPLTGQSLTVQWDYDESVAMEEQHSVWQGEIFEVQHHFTTLNLYMK